MQLKMNAIGIILFLVISLANANPFEAFYRGEPSAMGSSGTVFKTIKVQSAQLAESNLLAREDGECLRRALCAMGTTRDITEWPRLSLGKGLEHLLVVLTDMVGELQAVDENAESNYPKIHQAAASYQVGLTAKDPVLCNTLFACSTSAMELLAEIKVEPVASDFEEEAELAFSQPKATCSAAGKLCPGISIGCALCGLFSPGTCGDQCIVAGVYCGVSGYACKGEN